MSSENQPRRFSLDIMKQLKLSIKIIIFIKKRNWYVPVDKAKAAGHIAGILIKMRYIRVLHEQILFCGKNS